MQTKPHSPSLTSKFLRIYCYSETKMQIFVLFKFTSKKWYCLQLWFFCTQGYLINFPGRLFVIRYLKWLGLPNFVHWLIKCCKLILSYLDFLDYCFFSKTVLFFILVFLVVDFDGYNKKFLRKTLFIPAKTVYSWFHSSFVLLIRFWYLYKMPIKSCI